MSKVKVTMSKTQSSWTLHSVFISDPEPRVNFTNRACVYKDIFRHFHFALSCCICSDEGQIDVPTELPHTITEWVGSAVCTNQETGLGVAPTTSIKAFQPFFVSFTLPYSIIRGETVPVKVTVFNYLTECIVVSVLSTKCLEGFGV